MELTSSANPFLKSLHSCLAELEGEDQIISVQMHQNPVHILLTRSHAVHKVILFIPPHPEATLSFAKQKPQGVHLHRLSGDTGCSRVRLGLQRQGTYLVVELERRPSTPAGALTAFMGAMGNG